MAEKAVEAFPLCWPEGRPRTGQSRRTLSRFNTSFRAARDRALREIRNLGGREAIISSDLPLRLDGLPYANQRQPDDSGVAVYFTYKKRQMCFACDRWRKVEDNMHAIALTIGALRGVARWGTGDMMEAAFTGFTALPPPGQTTARGWRDILGHDITVRAQLEERYRKLRSESHPDKGGNAEAFNAVQTAYEQARQEIGA